MVNRTVKFKLDKPHRWKRQLIENAILEIQEIAREVYARMRSLPPKRWENQFYYWIKKSDGRDSTIDYDVHAQSAQVVLSKARENFRRWKAEGYQGSMPEPHTWEFVPLHNQQIQYFKKNGTYMVRFSIIPYESLYLPIADCDYYREILSKLVNGHIKHGRAELHRQNGEYYLHQSIREKEKKTTFEKIMGVDMGIKNLVCGVVVDEGDIVKKKFLSGKNLVQLHERLTERRKQLMKQGAYKKIKGKEKRIREQRFHKVSKEIVNIAAEAHALVVMEDLKGIKHQEHGPKKLNRMRGNFPFGDLQRKIAYKAEEHGVPVEKVAPAYTSKKCSRCSYEMKRGALQERTPVIGERRKFNFHCPHCGVTLNADVNAALNIAKRYICS